VRVAKKTRQASFCSNSRCPSRPSGRRTAPYAAGRPPPFDHVLGDARLRDLNPELEQFAVNAWRTPKRILHAYPPDIQLMSKHRVLSFRPQLRLEWRGQDGQNEAEQPDHSASLGDSITSSIRIRFSVHTPKVGWNSFPRRQASALRIWASHGRVSVTFVGAAVRSAHRRRRSARWMVWLAKLKAPRIPHGLATKPRLI
jgi:hypothetical protein